MMQDKRHAVLRKRAVSAIVSSNAPHPSRLRRTQSMPAATQQQWAFAGICVQKTLTPSENCEPSSGLPRVCVRRNSLVIDRRTR